MAGLSICLELMSREKTGEELIESLKIGVQEMLATEVSFGPEAVMTTISIPDPDWAETINS